MIQNFKCSNCGGKLNKINHNQWKCEHCDSIFENLNDKNPKSDLGIFVKYPSLSDANTLLSIEQSMYYDDGLGFEIDYTEKEMFLSELLNIPKRRLNTKYYFSLSREQCVHCEANADGNLICPNYFNHKDYDPANPPSVTNRNYKFNDMSIYDYNTFAHNSDMWALRSMFWYHWHNWKVDDIPSDDILLEKAQEALEEENIVDDELTEEEIKERIRELERLQEYKKKRKESDMEM